MSNQVKLKAESRPKSNRGHVKKLRREGLVPAVIYGAKQEAANLQVSRHEVEGILSHSIGENILVDLEIKEGDETAAKTALIQEIQHSPVSGEVLHVDFQAVSMDETISAEVPVEAVGEPVGVKNFGGVLESLQRSIEVECLPRNLPPVIEVDVSELNVGSSVSVKEVTLPEGVTAKTDPEVRLFNVTVPRVVEEEVPAEAAVEEEEEAAAAAEGAEGAEEGKEEAKAEPPEEEKS